MWRKLLNLMEINGINANGMVVNLVVLRVVILCNTSTNIRVKSPTNAIGMSVARSLIRNKT
jgi:hypothetical protein